MHFVQVKGLLSNQNGMNVYRGCSHGCIYCDSRSKCYGFTHPFEDIEVKENAVDLLEKALKSKRKRCMISTGAMCDPYLHVEESLEMTKKCLQVIQRYQFGVSIQTKSTRILRDIDLLRQINETAKTVIQMTMTTYNEDLCRIVEPNVSTTKERFEALLRFKEAGIPTIVWLTPILPFLNDTEENINGILQYCIAAGVKGIICFDMGLTLRDGDREYYYQALDWYFPGLKERYIKTYGNAYQLSSPRNEQLMSLFKETCAKYGIMSKPEECFAYMRQLPDRYIQQSLFDFLNQDNL